MAHTPYKNRKKEENFQRKRRLNPFTRAISTSVLNLLTPILIILVIVISSSCSGSGGAETQSSQAEITELAVTINGTDYPITFETDRTSTVSIPAAETIPGKITVKSAVISEKASGLQASDELAVTNNQASITITAEDGTKISYTLSLNILPTKITAAEIPKRADTDVRDSYVLFTIEANKNLSDYHLAVKETNEAAPTAAEMTAGALKRNLGPTAINVLIAQELNAPMVTFAKQYFADNTHRTLGTDMFGASWDTNFAMILDKTASGSNAWIAESVLEPSTQYTLYGMNQDENTVTELLTLTTDIDSSSRTGAVSGAEFIDTTLEAQHVDISVHANEYYIFPLQSHSTTALDMLDVEFSGRERGNIVIFHSSMAVAGFIDAGYHHQLLMFTQKNTNEETLKKGAYVLMSTSQMNKASPLNFGILHTFTSAVTSPTLMFSHLEIQE